jgi:hypothetical protein
MFRACLLRGYIGLWHEVCTSTGMFDATDNSFEQKKYEEVGFVVSGGCSVPCAELIGLVGISCDHIAYLWRVLRRLVWLRARELGTNVSSSMWSSWCWGSAE